MGYDVPVPHEPWLWGVNYYYKHHNNNFTLGILHEKSSEVIGYWETSQTLSTLFFRSKWPECLLLWTWKYHLNRQTI